MSGTAARTYRTLAYGVALVLLVALGYRVYTLQSWLLVTPPEDGAPPSAAGVDVAAPPPTLRDPLQIREWHLFGRAASPERVAPAPVTAPETPLKLELRGVFASQDAATARAIIGEPGKPEKVYGLGQSVPGGATLAEVRPDSVLLQRNQRYETLRLVKQTRAEGGDTLLPRGGAPAQRMALPRLAPRPANRPVVRTAPPVPEVSGAEALAPAAEPESEEDQDEEPDPALVP